MKSYLKFLSRNKLYTAIEAVGLAVSLAFVIIIGSYVWQQFSVTREHPNRERVYVPGMPGFPALTYGFPDAIGDIPEIESVSRMCNVAAHPVIRGEQTEAESVGVEPEFFEICPQFRFLEGSADVLSDPANVIISNSFAKKHSLSVGDALDISGTLSRRTQGCEQVAGVFKSFPTNNANMGEEDYAIISLMRSEDIPFAG